LNPTALSKKDDVQYSDLIVGVADIKLTNDPRVVISTYALGSCLGITLYDAQKKVGGMLHAMLPDSNLHAGQAIKIAMFLDTGLQELVNALKQLGCAPRLLECKVFGGAQVMGSDKFFKIGERNVRAFREICQKLTLNPTVFEVGGQFNRTIKLYTDSGKVSVRTPNQPVFWR
jgi:chemotaxis protein CheD